MHPVQFRVLGPVEVQAGSGQVMTAPRRLERSLLAILLLEAGRTVLMDRLVELLWEDEPPANPRRVVHTYVARVRAVLAGAGAADEGVALVSDRGGYVLRVDPALVDAHRFRALLGQATQTTDLAERGRLLAGALDLWRGPALENAATDRLRQRLCADLEELRLQATEESVATGLDLGRQHELLPELTKLVVEYPDRQRLVELHMLALYRAGRTSEALAAYADLRTRLADELGLDPNAALRRLHQTILRGEPAPGPRSLSPEVTPAQLPADLAGFAGRRDHLEWLDATLRAGSASAVVISAIAGTPGVGKTTLAVHWAHRVREQFPDGQLYANLRGFDPNDNAAPPAEVVRRFLDALAVPDARIPAEFGAQVDLYRSLLAGKRVLVILDNARDPDQVRPLLPGTAGCLTVVTSRNQLTGLVAIDGARPLALDLLSTEEAYGLMAGRLGSQRVDAEPAALEELVRLCARLPLALAIAAAHLATRPRLRLAELVDELGERRHRLDTLSGDDSATDIRAVFACSYRALSPAAARLFRLLGLHPGPDVSAPAAASIAGVPPDAVGPLLRELIQAHLVADHGGGRVVMHDLLREYAAERAQVDESEPDRRDAMIRMLDHYLFTAYQGAMLLAPRRRPVGLPPLSAGVTPEPPADEAAALAWCTSEHQVLVAVIQWAGTAGFDDRTWRLAWSLADYFDRRGHWQDRVAAQTAALGAVRRLGDAWAEAIVHRGLAVVYVRQGQTALAHEHSTHALRLAMELGDPIGTADSHRALASVAEDLGRYEEALQHAQQALAIFCEVGDTMGEARARNNVGMTHARLGDYRGAVTYCREALRMLESLGDRVTEAATWDSLGYAHNRLGEHHEAIACYRQALDRCRQLGDRFYESEALTGLGEAHRDAGDPAAAASVWQQALDILTDLRHPNAAAVEARLRELRA